jgi:glycosyltransferase involved in cell wall biosynthesis
VASEPIYGGERIGIMNAEPKGPPTVGILHYTSAPVIGGVEAVILSHCSVLTARGIPVTVLAGRGKKDALPSGTEFISIPELDSRHPEIQKMDFTLVKGRVPQNFERMTQTIREQLANVLPRFDHVIVHNVFTKHFNLPLTAALFRLVESGELRHCIAWCHDFSWTSKNSRSSVYPEYPWDLLRTYHPKISYVTISKQRKKSLVNLLGCIADQVKVIYNGVDADILMGISREGHRLIKCLGLLDSDLNMIMPVRVTHAKNIELALELGAAMKNRGIVFRLILTGPPDPHDPKSMQYFHSLQTKRDELGLTEEMRFIFESGPNPLQQYEIDFDRVCELLRASDLMLMPSHREGFGMPILEAGLLGLMIFTTEVPAASEIAEEYVHLFEPGIDPDLLAERILDVVGANAPLLLRRSIRKKYRWESIFQSKIAPLLGVEG